MPSTLPRHLSTLDRRLRRLEDALREQIRRRRCAVCRDWPSVQYYDVNPPDYLSQMSADDEDGAFEAQSRPTTPKRCPKCGWQPITVAVEYVDDWHEELRRSSCGTLADPLP